MFTLLEKSVMYVACFWGREILNFTTFLNQYIIVYVLLCLIKQPGRTAPCRDKILMATEYWSQKLSRHYTTYKVFTYHVGAPARRRYYVLRRRNNNRHVALGALKTWARDIWCPR